VRRLLAAGLLAVAACSSGAGPRGPERELPETMAVSSPALRPQAPIPVPYTCAGEEVSPPLTWSKVPDGTAELALVVDDPDAPGGTYVHWVVVHLDPAPGGLVEGALPQGATQLRNSAGEAAWAGPCPPESPAHHYRFTVCALARRVEVAADADPADAIAAIEQAATARGRLVATFAR
jgi:Raf kinase inhibitor-like YbhB/YbcL family protein